MPKALRFTDLPVEDDSDLESIRSEQRKRKVAERGPYLTAINGPRREEILAERREKARIRSQ